MGGTLPRLFTTSKTNENDTNEFESWIGSLIKHDMKDKQSILKEFGLAKETLIALAEQGNEKDLFVFLDKVKIIDEWDRITVREALFKKYKPETRDTIPKGV